MSSCTIFFGVSGLHHPEIYDVMLVMKKTFMIARTSSEAIWGAPRELDWAFAR